MQDHIYKNEVIKSLKLANKPPLLTPVVTWRLTTWRYA